MLNYTEKVKQHYLHPKNTGEIKNPDGKGEVGNPVCGDLMTIYIKVAKRKSKTEKGKEEEYIKDIKFKTFGCGAAIATSSMITELAKGKSLAEAEKITRSDVSQSLEGLPPIKEHCSNLAADGLRKAIEDYKKRKKN